MKEYGFQESHNKAVKSDAIDSASKAHGFAILCAFAAPLLRRLPWRYVHVGSAVLLALVVIVTRADAHDWELPHTDHYLDHLEARELGLMVTYEEKLWRDESGIRGLVGTDYRAVKIVVEARTTIEDREIASLMTVVDCGRLDGDGYLTGAETTEYAENSERVMGHRVDATIDLTCAPLSHILLITKGLENRQFYWIRVLGTAGT